MAMQEKTRELYEAALLLTDDQRAELVDELMCTLKWDESTEAAWLTEIERRVKEVREGTAELVSWEKVREHLHRRARGE